MCTKRPMTHVHIFTYVCPCVLTHQWLCVLSLSLPRNRSPTNIEKDVYLNVYMPTSTHTPMSMCSLQLYSDARTHTSTTICSLSLSTKRVVMTPGKVCKKGGVHLEEGYGCPSIYQKERFCICMFL